MVKVNYSALDAATLSWINPIIVNDVSFVHKDAPFA